MRWLPLALLLVVAGPAAAQESLDVIKPDDAPRKMLYTHMQTEAGKHFDARRAAVANLKTPDDVRQRQRDLRAKFVAALGGFPEKTPLNARVVGVEKRDGYRVERVVYESRPNHHVTANLYLPDGKGPFPGVLMPIGHSGKRNAPELSQFGNIVI